MCILHIKSSARGTLDILSGCCHTTEQATRHEQANSHSDLSSNCGECVAFFGELVRRIPLLRGCGSCISPRSLFSADACHVLYLPVLLCWPGYSKTKICIRSGISSAALRSNPATRCRCLAKYVFGLSVLWIALAFSLLIVYLNLQSEQVYKELIKLDRLKDQFLANTSHELRTPLNGIINITNSVLEDRAGSENTSQRHNLETVLSEARRLDRLIHDILDISSMRSGGIKLAPRSIDLHSIADASLYVISQLNDGKPIEFINRIPTDFPAVYADEERLYQIFITWLGMR